jgi:chromate transporter
MIEASPAPIKELAGLFLKLGTIAFGGPAAHIAMMEEEIVRKRQWLTHEEFLDLLGATNLMPGPNSTELAIHIGHAKGGWPGLWVAGVCFILPAFLIVSGFAWLYVTFGHLPELHGVLYGIKPVIIAVVLQALWSLGRKALKTRGLILLGIIAVFLTASDIHELVVLFGSGALMGLKAWWSRRKGNTLQSISLLSFGLLAQAPPIIPMQTAIPFSLWLLFVKFLKIGSVLFGSGYVLLAFLQSDFVERLGWLTQTQLLDAVAVGQVTPGPVFTTATFIGYILAGPIGALVATVGIFLPSFFFVAVSSRFIPRLRQSPVAGSVLDGVNVASLALMLVVTVQLMGAAFIDPATVLLGIASAVLMFRGVGSVWLVLGGGLIGYCLSLYSI